MGQETDKNVALSLEQLVELGVQSGKDKYVNMSEAERDKYANMTKAELDAELEKNLGKFYDRVWYYKTRSEIGPVGYSPVKGLKFVLLHLERLASHIHTPERKKKFVEECMNSIDETIEQLQMFFTVVEKTEKVTEEYFSHQETSNH